MINSEITVDLKTALLLKQKGFHEDTLNAYTKFGLFGESKFGKNYAPYGNKDHNSSDFHVSAPTLESVGRWLETKHEIFVEIISDAATGEYSCRIRVPKTKKNDKKEILISHKSSYGEAAVAGISKALKQIKSLKLND